MTYSYTIAVLLLIGLTGCTNEKKEKPNPSAEVVREIDMIRLTDLNGQSHPLKQYIGETIFINFWATWCKPCIQEMPSIKQMQNILQNENIIFLMASNESPEQIEEFINTRDYKFNFVRIENSEEMNVQALPTTFIFNKKGDLVFSETGSREWNKKDNIDLILKIAKEND
ncbi:MAG: TlpA family protein disulfide reductase [Bacteroidota bacterium]|nr:TlpA family protein disulfide reductase [Bacteroidota bacterium]